MINPNVLIGEPLNFKNKIKVYPPTVKEVVSNPKFHVFYRLLTITQEDIQEELQDKLQQGEEPPTPFEYLMANCCYTPGFSELMRDAFQFFCKTGIGLLYKENKILIGETKSQIQSASNLNELDYLTESDFFEFSNLVREACGNEAIAPPEKVDPDEDPQITRIKMLGKQRDRIKHKQQAKNGISLSVCLVAICCMGIGITPLNIGEMSYASVGELMKVMQSKEKYELDIRSLLAGADSKKIKPKYWIRNTDKE